MICTSKFATVGSKFRGHNCATLLSHQPLKKTIVTRIFDPKRILGGSERHINTHGSVHKSLWRPTLRRFDGLGRGPHR